MGTQRNSYSYFEDYAIKKKTASIDVKDKDKATDDNSFKRLEYWGIGSFYLVHYLGDHTVFVPFEHRNSKNNTKPFTGPAESVRLLRFWPDQFFSR